MKRRDQDRMNQDRRDRAGGMEHDPSMSGSKPGSMEREKRSIRPDEPQRRKREDDIIR
jgi:hypothetical protein